MIVLEKHTAQSLCPFQGQLEVLENAIAYPVADGADAFTINHGHDYGAFFSGMGTAAFLLARDDERVVGTLAGVRREVRRGTKRMKAVYIADLKLAPDYRGRDLVRKMLYKSARAWFTTQPIRFVPLLYAAAMRGANGDFKRTANRWSLMHLLQPLAVMNIYFVAPETLANLRGGPDGPAGHCLDLSASEDTKNLVVSTHGRKDLTLHSTQQPWPLLHVVGAPHKWSEGGLARRLRCIGQEPSCVGATICFAIDSKREHEVAWLASQAVEAGAICTLYASIPCIFRAGTTWTHLSTAEI